jgi:hypothetical protein
MKAKISLLTISVIFSLIVCEIILRVMGYDPTFVNPLNSFHKGDKELGWIGVSNFSGRFQKTDFNVLVSTNEDGFRFDKSNLNNKEDSKKVFFLGDSFVWGWGVDNENLFSDKLQFLLGENYDVDNYGVNAYGNVQELILFERLLSRNMVPTYLFVMIFKNDFSDNIDAQNGRRPFYNIDNEEVVLKNFPVSHPIGSWFKTFRRKSYILTYLSYWVNYYKQSRHQEKLEDNIIDVSKHNEKINRKSYLVMKHILNKFKSICYKNSINFYVVYIPYINDFKTLTPYRNSIANISRELGIDYIDLTDYFKDNAKKYYFKHDEHWNKEGHLLAAETLKLYIK